MEKQSRFKKRYKVAIYCRLSKDDDIRAGESASVQSQKDMLEKYVVENGWLIHDYYIDDGYTGTNFNRPDFQRMIDDIEDGKVDCVITKDLSRLGRNYILAGQYTEMYFPSKGVRYIALNDGVDTMNLENDIAPFKNILNEYYSRDMSNKIRSAIRAKQGKGEYLSNYAPIGYQKDPKNKHKLIVEETGAAIVRRIFEMARANISGLVISRIFTKEGIITPVNLRKLLLHGIEPTQKRWNPETVSAILRNRVYLGETVQGIYDCTRFKRLPSKRKPQEEWIITPDTHEPLVDMETFELANKLISERHRPKRTDEIQLFAGFVKCAECGYTLGYAQHSSNGIESYQCATNRRYGREACTCHYTRKDTLEKIVLDDIRKYAKMAKSKADELIQLLQEQYGDNNEAKAKRLKSDLKKLIARNDEIDRILKRLYEDCVSGKLPEDRFNTFLGDYEKEQNDVRAKIEVMEQEIVDIYDSRSDTESWINLIRNYTKIEKLDRTILTELVDKITVGEAIEVEGKRIKDITIYYRFIGAVA